MATAPRRPHVLAIDDAPAVQDLFRELSEDEGFRVSTGSAADNDLDEIQRLEPDLILLDCLRPGKDTGWSLLRMLRLDKGTAGIPVVLCTAAAREVEVHGDRLAELGVTAVLKPFDIDRLLAVVREALAATGAAPRAG